MSSAAEPQHAGGEAEQKTGDAVQRRPVWEPKYRSEDEEARHGRRIRLYPPLRIDLREAAEYHADPNNQFWCAPKSQIMATMRPDGQRRYIFVALPGREAEDEERRSQALEKGNNNLNLLDRCRDWYVFVDTLNGLDHWCLKDGGNVEEPLLSDLPLETYATMACFADMLCGKPNATILEEYRGLAPTKLLVFRNGSDDDDRNEEKSDREAWEARRRAAQRNRAAEPKYRTVDEEQYHRKRMTRYPPLAIGLEAAAKYHVDPSNNFSSVPIEAIREVRRPDGQKRYAVVGAPGREIADRDRRALATETGNLNLLDRYRDWYVFVDTMNGLDHWCLDARMLVEEHGDDDDDATVVLSELPLEEYKSMACFANLLYRKPGETILEEFRGLAPTKLLVFRKNCSELQKKMKSEEQQWEAATDSAVSGRKK